jgi:membrane protease YdiL (CAAX protease family)
MAKAGAFVRSHAVATYFAATFAISWGGLLALGGLRGMPGATWQSDPRLPFLVMAMLAGPSVAGLALTAIVLGRAGLHELFARLGRWRSDWRSYAVALCTAPAVFVAVHVALAVISPAFFPGIVTTSDRASLLVFGVAGALVVGLFEELGWTGFAVPALRVRYSAFATGFMVGVPWGAWHLLTNDIWIAGAYDGELPTASFVALNGLILVAGQLPAYRVLMVWFYDRTGSLLLAMLMHASLSACTFILGPTDVTGMALVTYGFALAAAWWLVVAVGAAIARGRVSRHVLPRPAA